MSDAPFKNPGWAGNTGEFDLTEAQVRGDDFVGERPKDGGHASGAGTLPYMLAEKHPEAPLFEGAYQERFDKILTRYPTSRRRSFRRSAGAGDPRAREPGDDGPGGRAARPLARVRPRGGDVLHDVQQAPGGPYLVQVCTNISCNLCGADEVLATFLRYTDTELGETSEDGNFTVIEAECLAACGFPPACRSTPATTRT
jgi:hypothetical protein